MLSLIKRQLPEIGRISGVIGIDPPRKISYATNDRGIYEKVIDEESSYMIRVHIKGEGAYAGIHTLNAKITNNEAIRGAFVTPIIHSDLDDDGIIPGQFKTIISLIQVGVRTVTKRSNNPQANTHLAVMSQGNEYESLRKHKQLYVPGDTNGFSSNCLDSELVAAMKDNNIKSIIREEIPGKVWSCPLLKKDFCDILLEELENIDSSNINVTRPNTMNNYGVVLGLIGLGPALNHFVEGYLVPVVRQLFGEIADTVDASHVFTIKYREGLDLGLDMHTDDSDITINVCLGKHFEGSGLQFCGFMGHSDHRKSSNRIHHRVGRCLIHLGRLRHGADDITSGERQNLIIWMRSTEFRLSEQYTSPPYEAESSPPDEVCLSFTHDRDFGIFKKYTKRNVQSQGRGWCPPRSKEYPNFKQEAPSCGSCNNHSH